MFLSIVVPCYNELSRGLKNISLWERLKYLKDNLKTCNGTEVIIVDDCSTDNSWECINDFIKTFKLDNWSCIKLDKNGGKGNALIAGFRRARGSYICYLDADMAVSPLCVRGVYERVDLSESVCFYGTRFKLESKIVNKRSIFRSMLTKSSRLLLNLLFGLKVSDIQCGFKVFPRDKLEPYLDLLYPSKWLLDVQVLYIMKLQGVVLKDYPVDWENFESESNVHFVNAVTTSLIDLIKILRMKSYLRHLIS